MKNLGRREQLRKTIAAKQTEIANLTATRRSNSVENLLGVASRNLTFVDQILGNSVEHVEYAGADDDEAALFGAAELFVKVASNQIARVVDAIEKFGPDSEVL